MPVSSEVWSVHIPVVLEKTLESPLGSKEIKPVNPKGNQPWIFIGRSDAEAEAPILWPSDVKTWLIGKDLDAEKDWRQEEKGATGDETVGWHHQLNGHEFAQTLGDDEGQGILVCCGPWGHKESDMMGRLNKTRYLFLLRYSLSVSSVPLSSTWRSSLSALSYQRGSPFLLSSGFFYSLPF